MKISPQTMAILRNFAGINPAIIVVPGSKIKVRAGSQALFYASAQVEEVFPVRFAIAELPSFISMSGLFDDPDYEFHTDHLVITDENKRKLTFRYANEKAVISVDYEKDVVFPSVDAEFTFSKSNQEALKNALAGLKAPQFAVIGDGKNIRVATYDVGNAHKDQFSIVVGETDKVFGCVHESAYMKLIPQEYRVTLYLERFITKFEGNPTYWMPGHVKSYKGK